MQGYVLVSYGAWRFFTDYPSGPYDCWGEKLEKLTLGQFILAMLLPIVAVVATLGFMLFFMGLFIYAVFVEK